MPITIVRKVKSFTDPASRIERLIARIEPRFRVRFLDFVKRFKDKLTLSRLEEFLRLGKIEEAMVLSEIEAIRLGRVWGDAYVLAGDEAAAFVANALNISVNFNVVNENALQQIRDNQLRLVREFTFKQRMATKEALENGVRRGINPRDMAREFRGSIGLTQRQVRAVNNFRHLLETNNRQALQRLLRDRRFDPSFRRAVNSGVPLRQDQIDKMVNRYRERYVKYRSEVIARTEALRSANAGTEQLYQQAISDGTMSPADLIREWRTGQDGRVRNPAHTAMHGQKRPFGQLFMSGKGNMLQRPGDPGAPPSETIQCRCALTTRFRGNVGGI